jgi:hypothetical protein
MNISILCKKLGNLIFNNTHKSFWAHFPIEISDYSIPVHWFKQAFYIFSIYWHNIIYFTTCGVTSGNAHRSYVPIIFEFSHSILTHWSVSNIKAIILIVSISDDLYDRLIVAMYSWTREFGTGWVLPATRRRRLMRERATASLPPP